MSICDSCGFKYTCEFERTDDIKSCASYKPLQLEELESDDCRFCWNWFLHHDEQSGKVIEGCYAHGKTCDERECKNWKALKERIKASLDNQEAKADKGKLRISLCPTQIIKDIAQVRMYGNEKYGSSDNWKTVEIDRYIDALLRHTLEFIKNKESKDEESGIEHYKHMACNMAFICDMMEER